MVAVPGKPAPARGARAARSAPQALVARAVGRATEALGDGGARRRRLSRLLAGPILKIEIRRKRGALFRDELEGGLPCSGAGRFCSSGGTLDFLAVKGLRSPRPI